MNKIGNLKSMQKKICCFVGIGANEFVWGYKNAMYELHEEYLKVLAYVLERLITKNGVIVLFLEKDQGRKKR